MPRAGDAASPFEPANRLLAPLFKPSQAVGRRVERYEPGRPAASERPGTGEAPRPGWARSEMDAPREDDVLLLEDEKFDFDLSLLSSSTNEDDEVFEPVEHKERCIEASLESGPVTPKKPSPLAPSSWPWTPLTGDAFVEVYKEAHLLALQIEGAHKDPALALQTDGACQDLTLTQKTDVPHQKPVLTQQTDSAGQHPGLALPTQPQSQAQEHFLQEPKRKTSLFEKEKEAERSPQSLKRETFCVRAGAGPRALPQGPSMPQKRGTSRLLLPRAPALRRVPTLHRKALEKPPKDLNEPAASPPRGRPPNEKEPSRDQRSGGDGVSLGPGKRSLPVPQKPGLRKTLLKPPNFSRKPLALGVAPSGTCGTRVSHSAAGQGQEPRPGEQPAAPSEDGRLPVAPSRAGPSLARQLVFSRLSCRQSQGAPQPPTELPRASRPPEPASRTPASRRSLSWSSRASSSGGVRRRESSLGSRTGVSASAPAPVEPFKVPRSPAGEHPGLATPQFPQAQKQLSHTPAGRTPLHSTPAPCSIARTPSASRRLSALPTPASPRLSSLPRATPRTLPRPASPLCESTQQLCSEPRRKGPPRTGPAWDSDNHTASSGSKASPDGSCCTPVVPQALRFSPEPSKQTTFGETPEGQGEGVQPSGPSTVSPSEVGLLVDIGPDQLIVAPQAKPALVEAPLIDFCSTPEASVVPSESRPLIDLLVNTPEWLRSSELKCKPSHEVVQLIDLASPLIQLSPEVDKENMVSPLLKF